VPVPVPVPVPVLVPAARQDAVPTGQLLVCSHRSPHEQMPLPPGSVSIGQTQTFREYGAPSSAHISASRCSTQTPPFSHSRSHSANGAYVCATDLSALLPSSSTPSLVLPLLLGAAGLAPTSPPTFCSAVVVVVAVVAVSVAVAEVTVAVAVPVVVVSVPVVAVSVPVVVVSVPVVVVAVPVVVVSVPVVVVSVFVVVLSVVLLVTGGSVGTSSSSITHELGTQCRERVA